MSDREWMEPIVERVVGQVLESHAAQLRSEIVRRVMDEMATQPAASSSAVPRLRTLPAASPKSSSAHRKRKFCARCSIPAHAAPPERSVCRQRRPSHGMAGRGFANSDAVKEFALDSSAPAVLRAIGGRVATSAAGSEFDARFFEQFGAPTGEARLLPLILKDKVAALVYADGGTGEGLLDSGALRCWSFRRARGLK